MGASRSGYLNLHQGELGIAYVRAVASAAEVFVEDGGRFADLDGVDLSLFTRDAIGVVGSRRLHVQVKTWTGSPEGDTIPYDLKRKSYNDLRIAAPQVPRLLVLVLVPPDPSEWVTHTNEALLLRRCGYWLSLRGAPPTPNDAQVRVSVPRAQVFDVPTLRGLMAQLADGVQP
ncbi:MAG: hypothetical protein RIT28_2986 [Pseudomonadota bacterium]